MRIIYGPRISRAPRQPRQALYAAQCDAAPRSPGHPLARRRIVVVDDDVNQAAALARLLASEGIVATHEHVATTALARISVEPPDAIVVDVKMPGLPGPDLLAALRAKHPSLPAMFLTGFDRCDPRLRGALELGRVAYLSKPAEFSKLLEALTGLLDEPPAAADT